MDLLGRKFYAYLLVLMILLIGCSTDRRNEDSSISTLSPEVNATFSDLRLTSTPIKKPTTEVTNDDVATPLPNDCSIGTGLRRESVEIILKNKNNIEFVMAASSEMAERYFPQLEGSIRVLGAPSLEALENKAKRAKLNQLPYEALSYGLETSRSTPEIEWRNPVESTFRAIDLVEDYDKELVMGPGFQLMARNQDKYPIMATLTDIWLIQTQQLQKSPPSPSYREEIEKIINLIRADNPDIEIWAQITLPPDREPDAAEWLEYHDLIEDLVDGTYIGVYTWNTVDEDILIHNIETIFESICGDISIN